MSIDELCEKVLLHWSDCVHWTKEGHGSCSCGANNHRNSLKEALTSGLLCDGKKLEEAKKEIESREIVWGQCKNKLFEYEQEILSLKAKLSEAEKEIEELRKDNVLGPWKIIDGLKKDRETAKNNWVICREKLAKLSGPCEGITVQSMLKAVHEWEEKNNDCTPTVLEVCQAIHAQMTEKK